MWSRKKFLTQPIQSFPTRLRLRESNNTAPSLAHLKKESDFTVNMRLQQLQLNNIAIKDSGVDVDRVACLKVESEHFRAK